MIPLRTLRDGLRKASADADVLAAFLVRHVRGCVITMEEDERLTKLGLRSRMPDGAGPDDLLARYRAAGIAIEEVTSA